MPAIVNVFFRVSCIEIRRHVINASKVKGRDMMLFQYSTAKGLCHAYFLCSLAGTNSPTYDNLVATIGLNDVTTSNPNE